MDIEGQSEKEFVNGAQKTHKEMYQDVSFEKIEILKVDELQKCNHQFQCLITIRSYQKNDNKDSSFTTTMVAMSDKGIKWVFVHGEIEGLKKRYPDICW